MKRPSRGAASRRGSSLVFVLGILAVFGLVLGVLATVLLTDLRASRRRANERYAVELARSGVDWGRAWLMERGTVPPGVVRLERGEFEVRVEELASGARRIVSTGRVREGAASLAARREIVDLPAPPVSATP